MRQVYRVFWRENGTRYPDQAIRPKPFHLEELPKDSIFHAVSSLGENPEIDTTLPYFQGYSKKIGVSYVTDYIKPQGTFRRPMFTFQEMIRPWKRNNIQKFEIVESGWRLYTSPEQLLIVNYGYLDVIHKYIPMQLTEYWRWSNRTRTIYETMNQIANESGRNQFMIIKIPAVLQGRTMLEKFQDREDNIMTQNIFGMYGIEGFLQLDFWRWLSVTYRNRSLLAAIEPRNYGRINFIFEGRTGKQVLTNLAYLDAWIKGQPNTTEIASLIQLSAMNIQKIFTKMWMTLNDLVVQEDETGEVVMTDQPRPIGNTRTTYEPPLEKEETSNSDNEDDRPMDDLIMEEENHEGSDAVHISSDFSKKITLKNISEDEAERALAQHHKMKSSDYANALLNDIEQDMEALDRISLVQIKNKGLVKKIREEEAKVSELPQEKQSHSVPEGEGDNYTPPPEPEIVITHEEAIEKIFKSSSPEDVLKRQLAENAEANLISASDYRKLSEAIANHENSLDPYGSGKPRKEVVVIKPEDTVITDERKKIVVSEAVPDSTMAESSLQVFTRDYVKSFMKKDILNMVDALQNTGIVIKNHEITTTTSAMGTYENHRLEIKPIDGQPSTISFTLPVVNEEGWFMAAGNKYTMRLQRVDSPLRKISPSVVSLSTYYGKTFVQLSPKMTNNSVNWLYKQINLAVVTDGSYIHSVSPGNVFDCEVETPFIYGAIANEYEKLAAGNLYFMFNYHKRKEFIDPQLLASIEKDGAVFCGYAPGKTPIVVNKKDRFVIIGKDGEKDIGTIFDVLKLPLEKAPVDFSEVRIFSKYIPTVVVLSYYVGFKAVLSLLKLTEGDGYRIVPARKNKALQPDEYAIVFKDKTYVFSRKNRLATLMMAGFLEFENSTKLYDSELFETKDVYLNLLMTKKMGSIYIREMDIMEHAFVDPISKEILESMNEPVTFKGLLYRATQMLQTYHHPISQDHTVMRIRGYERFSGAVYKELVQAIRGFKNRNLIGRSKVDISPYQVWNSIMKDSSLKIVEDINPIQNLKEMEVVTYSGTGGRDKETMTKPTRAYHKSDVGVLSESTVDSAAVGTIAYMSANPNIKTIRGIIKEEKTLNPTSMLSTAALVSPASTTDNQLGSLS